MNEAFQSKLDAARKLFEQHNYLRTENRIDIDRFFESLRRIGGVTNTTLHYCNEKDLLDCGLPPLIARQICDVFHGLVIVNEYGKLEEVSNV